MTPPPAGTDGAGRPPGPPTSTATDYPSPASAWWIVFVLTIAYVFSFIDRQILTLLVAPIRRDLQITDLQMSYLLGFSFAIFYALFGLPLGRAADRMSRRGLVAWGMVLWSGMTALCGMAGQYWQLFLARMGVGVGVAAVSPGAYSLIADCFPPERRSAAMSVYSSAIYIGGGIALLLGGMLVKLAGTTEVMLPVVGAVHPWQVVFFAVGVPGLFAALLMLTFREPIRRGPGAGPGGTVMHVPFSEVLAHIRSNRVTVLCHHLGFALMAMGGYAVTAWGPTLFQRHWGWTAAESGVRLGIGGVLFGATGCWAGGWFASRLARRGVVDADMRVGSVGAIVTMVLYLAYVLAPNAWTMFAITSVGLFFSAFPWGIAAASLQRIMPNPMRGQASALYLFTVSLIGLGLGPSAVAFFTDKVFHFDAAVYMSLCIVTTATYGAAAVLLRVGLGPFRRSVERLDSWRPTTQ